MAVFICRHPVARFGYRGDQPFVGVVTARHNESGFGTMPTGEGGFYFVPDRMMAAEQARGGSRDRQSGSRGREGLVAVGEVVVRCEVDTSWESKRPIAALGPEVFQQCRPTVVEAHTVAGVSDGEAE